MAKMTRSKLKGIVKECLVEILSEGLNTESIEVESAKTAATKTKHHSRQAEEKRLAEHRKKFDYRVEDTVSGLTDDPIMASIFKDTASTTLQEQYENRGATAPLSDPTRQTGVSLDGLFGNATTNWEKLAFEDKSSG
jgi:hypothetical protein